MAREGCARLCRHCQQLGTAPVPNHQDNAGFVQISPLKQAVRGFSLPFPCQSSSASLPSGESFSTTERTDQHQLVCCSSGQGQGGGSHPELAQEVGGQRQVGSAGGPWLPMGALLGRGHSQGKERVRLVLLEFLSTALSWDCCGPAGIPPQPVGCIPPSLYGKFRSRAKQEGLVTPSLSSSSTC